MVQAYVSRWETEKDGLEEFFIKNLETVQGDERDVIFISTVYGPETPGGRVLQRFGSTINSPTGHRRLNVLFSRAKRKIVTFTSMKPTDILEDDNKKIGIHMFRAWLEYSKTKYISEPVIPKGATESPFEDYVAQQIETMGCIAVPQVGVAGFRIDLGVRHPDWPYGYILGVECDGATYHSSKSSRDRDRLRQEILEGLRWKLHRIWSTDWFRNPRNEIEKLREAIYERLETIKNSKIDPLEREAEHTLFDEHPTDPDHASQANLPIGMGKNDIFMQTATNGEQPIRNLSPHSYSEEPIISLGSKVKIENLSEGGKKLAFTLIAGESNPEEGLVGIYSPLGAALIDAQIGDSVEYLVGSYIKEVRVLEIS